MKMELDFINEGLNAEKIARNFARNKQIKIPIVYWNRTTKKVLTMEWCPGVKITDVQGIKDLGLNLKEVVTLFTELFSEQIFVHGFLHADPHPGNIFVRIKKGTKNTPEIVLLDHGLCKEIVPSVRIPYCKLWKAIVLQDKKEIETQARMLGAGDFHLLFRFILTFRPEHTETTIKLTQEEKGELLAQVRDDHGIIKELLKHIPHELLLVLKTQALIRSINKQIGANVNRFVIMARYSIMGLNASEVKPKSVLARLGSWKELIMFDLMLNIYAVGMWISSVWRKLLSSFGLTKITDSSFI